MLEYSRDALAEPLRETGRVYAKIAGKKFLPDETRSGRWLPENPADESEDTAAEDDTKPDLEEEEDIHGDIAEEAWLGATASDLPPFPVEGATSSRHSKIVHRSGGLLGTTACGHTFTVDTLLSHTSWPSGARLCRRPACFRNCVKEQGEAESIVE